MNSIPLRNPLFCFAVSGPDRRLSAAWRWWLPRTAGRQPPVWRLWLAVSFLLMLLYECWWLRYFRSPRTMMDFYSSLLGIPVAGASLPVMAFLLLGVYRKSPLLAASSALLGIGHIGIHLQHRRGIAENPPRK